MQKKVCQVKLLSCCLRCNTNNKRTCFIFVSNKHQSLSTKNHSLKCGLFSRKALEEFKRGTLHVMVAFNALTHGMDVENIANVMNYDVPIYVKTYLHYVGHIARAGQGGSCFHSHGQKGRMFSLN